MKEPADEIELRIRATIRAIAAFTGRPPRRIALRRRLRSSRRQVSADVCTDGTCPSFAGRAGRVMQSPTFLVETITPDKAREYLAANRFNRPLSRTVVADYVAAMKAGEWLLNGEAIKFDWNGQLVDGQHRLEAIVRAEVPTDFVVIRDLDPGVFKTLDTGKKRTAADVLSIAQIPNAEAFGVAFRLLHRTLTGEHRSKKRVSNSQLEALRQEHPTLVELGIEAIHHPFATPLMSPGQQIFTFYMACHVDDRRARAFFRALAGRPDDIPKQPQAAQLRAWLQRRWARSSSRRRKCVCVGSSKHGTERSRGNRSSACRASSTRYRNSSPRRPFEGELVSHGSDGKLGSRGIDGSLRVVERRIRHWGEQARKRSAQQAAFEATIDRPERGSMTSRAIEGGRIFKGEKRLSRRERLKLDRARDAARAQRDAARKAELRNRRGRGPVKHCSYCTIVYRGDECKRCKNDPALYTARGKQSRSGPRREAPMPFYTMDPTRP
jgi:hypothetical protein